MCCALPRFVGYCPESLSPRCRNLAPIVVFHPSLPSIMGRRGNAKGGGKGAGKAGEQPKESQYVKRVDLYKFLGKWILRSYRDERGRPLMLGAKSPRHKRHWSPRP